MEATVARQQMYWCDVSIEGATGAVTNQLHQNVQVLWKLEGAMAPLNMLIKRDEEGGSLVRTGYSGV